MISPLNFLKWHVREISRRDSQCYLFKLCSYHAVRLLVLIEPMTNVAQLDTIQRMLKFSFAQSFLEGKIGCFGLTNFQFPLVNLVINWSI